MLANKSKRERKYDFRNWTHTLINKQSTTTGNAQLGKLSIQSLNSEIKNCLSDFTDQLIRYKFQLSVHTNGI